MAESLAFAAPVHYRMGREGKDDRAIRRLVFFNSFRLLAATASSAILPYLLVVVLSA